MEPNVFVFQKRNTEEKRTVEDYNIDYALLGLRDTIQRENNNWDNGPSLDDLKNDWVLFDSWTGNKHFRQLTDIIDIEDDVDNYESQDRIVVIKWIKPHPIDKEVAARTNDFWSTSSHCGHEYDCCGCAWVTVYTHKQVKLEEGVYLISMTRFHNV
jgi:hypothetical protein